MIWYFHFYIAAIISHPKKMASLPAYRSALAGGKKSNQLTMKGLNSPKHSNFEGNLLYIFVIDEAGEEAPS
jgi:hypothetical protein